MILSFSHTLAYTERDSFLTISYLLHGPAFNLPPIDESKVIQGLDYLSSSPKLIILDTDRSVRGE